MAPQPPPRVNGLLAKVKQGFPCTTSVTPGSSVPKGWRQAVGWEPAPQHEVDQFPTAGRKEVWSQSGQKPSREGHPGRGDGSQETRGGGTGWDWEPA